MCIVKVPSGGSTDNLGEHTEGGLSGFATPTTPYISGGSGGGRRASGPLVPAIDGSGMVEVVDPHSVLMPGLYETWLVRGAGWGVSAMLRCMCLHRAVHRWQVRVCNELLPHHSDSRAQLLHALPSHGPFRSTLLPPQVCEYCDRGSLSDLLAGGKLVQMAVSASQSANPVVQAAHRDAWLLLCLLDIAQGLDYLHEATIVHGDLKVGAGTEPGL